MPSLSAFDYLGWLFTSALPALTFWVGVVIFSELIFPAVLGGTLYLSLLGRRLRLAETVEGGLRYKAGETAMSGGLKT